MELRHLRYFVAAAETQHFGRAARKLGIVQPALSKQVRELEEELGVPLFERLPRGVRLTESGASFKVDAVALLHQLGLAAEKARAVARGELGCLRLGFVDTAMNHPGVPGLVGRFRHDFPSIRLELTQAPSVSQWEMLRTGRIDAGLLYHLPAESTAHESLVIGEETIMLAVPKAHPLARHTSVLMRELAGEGFVWMPRAISPPFNDAVQDACRQHGFHMGIVQEATTDHAIMSLVAAGAGVTFCIASAKLSKPRDVRILPIRDLRLAFKLRLCWLSGNGNPTLARLLETWRTYIEKAAPLKATRPQARRLVKAQKSPRR